MPLAGSVNFSASTFQCPQASVFVDAFGGLYGPGAYESTFASPWDGLDTKEYYREPCQYLTSTLQFGCAPCPSGTYSLAAGHSDGTPPGAGNGSSGGVVNPLCAPCPFGGVCNSDGAVSAQPGYWGAASSDGSVSFAVCPIGYCCSDVQSCSSINACGGGRTGPLCGDCGPGMVQSVISPVCVPVKNCSGEVRLFWVCVVLGVFGMAFIQLLFVSNLLPHLHIKIRFGAKYLVRTLSSRLPNRLLSSRITEGHQKQSSSVIPMSALFKVAIYFSQVLQ